MIIFRHGKLFAATIIEKYIDATIMDTDTITSHNGIGPMLNRRIIIVGIVNGIYDKI